MVTLRGKKANAKPKSAAAASATDKQAAAAALAAAGKAKSAAVSGAGTASAPSLSAQQAKAQELLRQREEERAQAQQRQKEERVLQLLQFATRTVLAEPANAKLAETCDTLLTALCGSGKDKRASPAQLLEKLTRNVRKRVCGAIFASDEIAYSCRNCQVDSTSVICQDCFAHRCVCGEQERGNDCHSGADASCLLYLLYVATTSDHAGHDVYFQRTTAGSSCDCGDSHVRPLARNSWLVAAMQATADENVCHASTTQAWKPQSFCSKHPGIDDTEASTSKKHKMPKNIGLAAPVVIDAVVEHVFQVLLMAQHGFELADAMEVFSRDLAPSVRNELTSVDEQLSPRSSNHRLQQQQPTAAQATGAGSSGRAASRVMNVTTPARRSRATRTSRHTDAARESKSDRESSLERKPAAASAPTQFFIRLHNDDVHTLSEVVNHIASVMSVPKFDARDLVSEADRVGDIVLGTRDLLGCASAVGELVRNSLNVTATPTWWQACVDTLPELLQWLFSLSCLSDGLNELVAEELYKPRVATVKGFDTLSDVLLPGSAPKKKSSSNTSSHAGASIEEFLKEQNARMNSSATALFESLLAGRSVVEWARDVEAAQRKRFTFRVKASDEAPSVVRNTNGDVMRSDNVFIDDFLKAVALTTAYSRHQSVRDGVDAVVARFFTVADDAAPELSALTLLVQYDCILRKETAKKSHLLLREHMLNARFRSEMLESYARAYRAMTANFLRGLGNSSDTVFDFAVQFLTVPHLVKNYTRRMTELHPERPHLLGELFAALELVFRSAVNPKDGVLSVEHPALGNQKYKVRCGGVWVSILCVHGANDDNDCVSRVCAFQHCVDNMEYVLNIGAIPNELVCDLKNLAVWLSCLKILQNGDLQARRSVYQTHVEYESDSWLSMFNLGIRVHSVFPVAWNGFQPGELVVRNLQLSSIFSLIIDALITRSSELNATVSKKLLAPATALVAASDASAPTADAQRNIAAYSFNVGSDPTSLHIPLHRFLAASIRHLCIHQTGFADQLTADTVLSTFGLDVLSPESRLELVEMPLRCLVMASQIHSNLWRRNGDENMLAQLYNYSALPYCLNYRDADVFMLQLGVLLLGPDVVLALMLNQFQLGGYFVRPVTSGATAASDSGTALPATELETAHALGYLRLEDGIDRAQMLLMVEEFLRLVIVVGTSLPSATGVAYENAFLAEEMLQQLCAKSYTFSKLFDLAVLPSGQDDLAIPRLEEILVGVADFVPPSGLDSGRYELKDGFLDRYNPYFLHLNREAHELARDKWTSYRKQRLQKKKAADDADATPHEPLRAAAPPVHFLRPVQHILLCDSTVTLVQMILWKVLRADGVSASASATSAANAVSDAVISTCLHVLVHGVHTAIASPLSSDGYFARLCAVTARLDNTSVLHLLSRIYTKRTTVLDEEQAATVEWLMWKLTTSSSVCRAFLAALEEETTRVNTSSARTRLTASSDAAPLTLTQRKDEARARALAAMAKQQAAFQAMMGSMENDVDDDDSEEKKDGEAESAMSDGESDALVGLGQLGKRRASVHEVDDELKKRQKIVEDASHKCILCHDTSTQGEMGMTAYVHQSTVLATAFRPEAHEALGPTGKKVRSQVKQLVEKMELCSGGPGSGDLSPSPRLRGYSVPFPDWYMDDSLALGPPVPQVSPRQRRLRQDGLRGPTATLPMLEGEMLQTDEEMDVLEGVLNLREDQQLFPMDMRRAIDLDLRGARAAAAQQPPRPRDVRTLPTEARRTTLMHHHHHHHQHHHHHHHGFSDDSDDDDGEEFTPGFHGEFSPPGISSANRESAKLYLTPCGLHIRTCQHAVHIHCLERYIASLHEKAIRGEEFDGVQAIDPDSAMTQFLCPLCKTLCNFLIPTSDPALASEPDSATPLRALTTGDNNTLATALPWHSIVEEQMKVSGWYKTVLGQFGDAKSDGDSVHDMWRDYFEETMWEPHGSLEKGAPFLWSACAFSVAAFLTVAEDEHRAVMGGNDTAPIYDPLADPCPPSMEKELASLAAVTKFCRWSFSLLEHSADAKVIWETSKRCCPINSETKREYRKFTTVRLPSLSECVSMVVCARVGPVAHVSCRCVAIARSCSDRSTRACAAQSSVCSLPTRSLYVLV